MREEKGLDDASAEFSHIWISVIESDKDFQISILKYFRR